MSPHVRYNQVGIGKSDNTFRVRTENCSVSFKIK